MIHHLLRTAIVFAALLSLGPTAWAQGTPGTLYVAPATPLGRPLPFQVSGGTPGGGYYFDLSLAGSQPGFQVAPGGPIIPMNRPYLYLDIFGLSPALAPIFVDFLGQFDGSGRATPRLDSPIVDGLEGTTMTGSCIGLNPLAPFGIATISNSASTMIVRRVDPAAGFAAPFSAPAPIGAATHFVSPTGSNANNGLSPATAWREISWAATHVAPGAIIDIADGNYAGPVLIQNLNGTAASPTIFRATGQNAVLTGSGSTNNTNRNSIFIGDSAHVVIHGLRVFSSQRSGCRVSLSHHVTVQNCVFGNHQKWGIFTDYADDLALVGNECFGSIDEHGIYHSNSGDRGVIVGNFCHDNKASGIQINADPVFLAPIGGYVPDGISFHSIVERNLLINNGQLGGAAINLASVRSSVIRNNVIINSQWANSTGIALWDDAAGVQWGSMNNLVEHNTIAYFTGAGRYCISIMNGSTGNVIRNNVLRGGRRGAIAFFPDCLPGLISDGNLMFSVDGWPIVVRDDANFQTYSLAQWQALGFDAHSFHANAVFAAPSTTAPAGADWSLAPGSAGHDAGIISAWIEDFRRNPRPVGAGVDIGAYEN